MGAAEAIEPDSAPTPPLIELRVDAEPTQLGVVRAVAGTIAAQADFDLDTIADIRLAVDEAASYLVVRAVPGSQLWCMFRNTGNVLAIAVSAATTGEDQSLRQSFGTACPQGHHAIAAFKPNATPLQRSSASARAPQRPAHRSAARRRLA